MENYHRYPPSRPSLATMWAYMLLIVAALVIAWRFWPGSQGASLDPNAQMRSVTPRGSLAEDEKSTIDLFKKASPSVVHIVSLAVLRDRFTFGQVRKGTGTGFIWNQKEGGTAYIVTNYHVVKDAQEVRVILADNSMVNASKVSFDPDHDLAVLWVQTSKNLKPIAIGKSGDLLVGQKVFAIGNPFGLDQTLTHGIISALGRQIDSESRRPIKGVIQTDAAINPGNSGGPLLDSAGLLIGVNTAIVSPSGSSAGIGFAIPVDDVNRVVTQLISHGKIVRPSLGIQIAADQLARRFQVTSGVLILNVTPGGPAEKAGLKPTVIDEDGFHRGDVIVAIDGKKVASTNDFYVVLEQYNAGDQVTVTVMRGGQTMDVKMTLGVGD